MDDLLPFTGCASSDASSMCSWRTKVSLPLQNVNRVAPSNYSSSKRVAYLEKLFGVKKPREVVKQVLNEERLQRIYDVRERLQEKERDAENVSSKRDAILVAYRAQLQDLKLPLSATLENMDRKNLLNPRTDAISEQAHQSYLALSAGYYEYD